MASTAPRQWELRKPRAITVDLMGPVTGDEWVTVVALEDVRSALQELREDFEQRDVDAADEFDLPSWQQVLNEVEARLFGGLAKGETHGS